MCTLLGRLLCWARGHVTEPAAQEGACELSAKNIFSLLIEWSALAMDDRVFLALFCYLTSLQRRGAARAVRRRRTLKYHIRFGLEWLHSNWLCARIFLLDLLQPTSLLHQVRSLLGWLCSLLLIRTQEKLKLGMSDDDVTVLPWLPSNIFLVVSMIWFSYTDKYIKMLRFSKEID